MKRTVLDIIFLLSILSVPLFSACEKERAIEDPIVVEPPEIETGTDDVSDITALIQPQLTSEAYPYSVSAEVGEDFIKLYPVEGEGEATLRHSIYPFYAFENSDSNGDYYLIRSEITIANEKMYNGYNSHGHISSYSKRKSYTNICGYYMREMRVSYTLIDKYGDTVGEFPVKHSPTPLTTIGSTTYTSGFSWSLGAQIRIGTDTALKSKPLIFNISYNNEAKRNIQDMDIRNSSSDQVAQYAFVLNNLPMYNTSGLTPRLPPPALSVNTGSYFQEFIWRVPTTKDGQGDDTRFSLFQEIEIDYGVCYSVTHEDGHGAIPLKEITRTVEHYSIIDLTPPCRIPMGTLKITNKNQGQYVTQIAVAKKGQQPQVVSKGSLAYGKSFEIYLDVGQYDVTFKMGTTSKNAKTYKLDYDFAEISQDETLELFSDFDFTPL